MRKLVISAIARMPSRSSPLLVAISTVALAGMLSASGITQAIARNEAAVGQCGLAFMHSIDRCNANYGGFSQKIRLQACINAANSRYNSCMDKALAAPAMTMGPSDPPKKRPTPPSAGIMNDQGLSTQGPGATGGSRGTRGGGSGTLY